MNLLITGISRGMIYFLLSAGLTLIFGVMQVINFAHGTFYMLGVYLCYSISRNTNFLVAFVATPIIMGLIGALVESSLFRRVYKAEHVMHLLLSVGVIYVISDIVRLVWGVDVLSGIIPDVFRGFFEVKGIAISKYNIFIIIISMLITILMLYVLFKTRTGSIIRACVIDPELTSCAGINVSRVFLLVFMVGVGLAGLASATAFPITTAILGMDMQMIIVAFSVVIIGGAGNIVGAFISALLIGISESVGILILPRFAEAFMYIIVVAVLFFRPQGLFSFK
jgi:branched-chain amino acid transport system permease protein